MVAGHSGRTGVFKLGDQAWQDVPVAVVDLAGITGLVSLTAFRSVPVTIDVHEDGPYSTEAHIDLTLPGGQSVKVEVDTGSGGLILNEPFAAQNAISLEADGIRKLLGQDETGHEYARYLTTLPGDISLTAAPAFRQHDPRVTFQRIIHDGLIGDEFLRSFVTTYDLTQSRMIFAPRH